MNKRARKRAHAKKERVEGFKVKAALDDYPIGDSLSGCESDDYKV